MPTINSLTRINSTVKDLFIYLYDLSPLDLEILFLLIGSQKSETLEDLAKMVERDKSTVFRSLQKLVLLSLCVKETKTLKEGGYYHTYTAVDAATFKAETERRVRELQKSLDRLLRKFEEDMNKAIASFYDEKEQQNPS